MRAPHFVQGCARSAVFLQKYFEFQILWSLSSVDFFLSQSNFQFQLDFNLRFVFVLDTLQSQLSKNIFLKVYIFSFVDYFYSYVYFYLNHSVAGPLCKVMQFCCIKSYHKKLQT